MWNTSQKVRVGFGIALAFSLSAVALSYRTTIRLIESNVQLGRSNAAFTNLFGTVAALDNLERSRLAWVNAGRAMHHLRVRRLRDLRCRTCHSSGTESLEAIRFRNTHLSMVTDLNAHSRALRAAIAFEPAVRERWAALEPLIEKKVALARAEADPETMAAFNETESTALDENVRLTPEIRTLITEMERTETGRLARVMESRRTSARGAIAAITLLGFLTLCVSVIAYVIIRRDLARTRVLEEQLRQNAKMEAVGRLAAGVAHDFNNLLTPILSYAELLETELGAEHPLGQYAGEITKAGQTAASVAQQLLAFGRRQALQPQKLNLNAVATNMGALLTRLIGDRHRVETVLEPELGWVEADPSQIEQVVMNLVLNARDAMPGGGLIELATANASLEARMAGSCGLAHGGEYVRLAVSDHGPGMDEATRSQMFEPFFTTKQGRKGTGLGLATVYGIVAQSRGGIRVESAPGRGTTIEVLLPRTAPPARSAAPAAGKAAVIGAPGRILLVEDDEAVRRVLRNVLTGAGYEVTEARDGEEAWLAAQACADRIDLLASDITMPRMNGPELRQKLLTLRPGLRTIFVSGYAAAAGLEKAPEEGTIYLQKPFTPAQFLARVAQSLGGSRSV